MRTYMASLLNTNAPMSSEISMILQLAALAILIIGFIVVKQKKYMPHGVTMLLATLMNLTSVAVVMVPVALRLADTSIPGFNLLFRTHAILGVTVLALSIWIVADWRFQKPGPTCFQRKKWMLGLDLTWVAELIMGMLLFLELYQ
jgi:ABC-type tungstate transport system substrate-binding protein